MGNQVPQSFDCRGPWQAYSVEGTSLSDAVKQSPELPTGVGLCVCVCWLINRFPFQALKRFTLKKLNNASVPLAASS